jgi:hypothetical protein
MVLDFNKLGGGDRFDTATSPREIFVSLPNKKEGKFEYPRDVQSQVWGKWYQRRDDKDIVIKMNTGSGKTIVGLVVLKSCLNERKGPAVYVVPDNYLVQQVFSEAKDLGIEVTEEHQSPRFLSGKAILIINIQKLVNGKSIFGVGSEGSKIRIGSLLIDDAHACLDTVEEQFTLTIDINNPVYTAIYNCVKDSLHSQSESKAYEIENQTYAFMQVPFWNWQSKVSEISRILSDAYGSKNNSWLMFKWYLVKEYLKLSRCVVSSTKIEITPHFIPIDVIPSITNAQRRIFMTATLVNDTILTSHFGITDSNSITQAIVPDSAGDIGDRMILMPQVINPDIKDEEIKELCKEISQTVNVVVIVPSKERARFWKDKADLILDRENLNDGVTKLKGNQKIGLVILVNRYDGVDLPKDACRLLVIDGVPNISREIDKVNSVFLAGSSVRQYQLIQKIEQGMGRGVRSSEDYCVVLLIGQGLISQIYVDNGMQLFSPATKAQLELSDGISEQILGKGLNEIKEVMMYCLDRNPAWVSTSKGKLASLSYGDSRQANSLIIRQRKAFDYVYIKNLTAATQELRESINEVESNDKSLKGYLKQCLAEYINFYDPIEAQKICLSAVTDNPTLIKPIEGIAYHKLESPSLEQARACVNYLQQKFTSNPNKILVSINSLLESLIFKPETANEFEESMKKLACYIGFLSQRPEQEVNDGGPDVLWSVGSQKYFVIECKNGATTDRISKSDCNQLTGSCNWFLRTYDHTCNCIPILVHPSKSFNFDASPNQTTRIIDLDKLDFLRKNIHDFFKSICSENRINERDIRERLITYNLTSDTFVNSYTTQYFINKGK